MTRSCRLDTNSDQGNVGSHGMGRRRSVQGLRQPVPIQVSLQKIVRRATQPTAISAQTVETMNAAWRCTCFLTGITAALSAIGCSGAEMSWHGFRTLASTPLNELSGNDRWIETQLSRAVVSDTSYGSVACRHVVEKNAWSLSFQVCEPAPVVLRGELKR
jgi:hypothetical protein